MIRSSKDKCLLCLINAADKKGSHIIPSFLISTAISYKGSKKRDMEIMSIMKNSSFNESFIGRNVLPEAIAEVKEKALNEEELVANQNPNIKDFIFCTNCEKRLAVVENLFAEKVANNIDKYPQTKGNGGYQLIKLENNESLITQLFFISVLWRVSATKDMPIQLPINIENSLRSVLDLSMKNTREELDKTLGIDSSIVAKHPIIILNLPENKIDATKSIIFANEHRFPHLLILNRFILLFYEKKSHLSNKLYPLFGLREIVDLSELVNIKAESCTIGVLTKQQRDTIRKEILTLLVGEMRNTIKIHFSIAHEAIFGFRPPHDVIYTLSHRIAHSRNALFDKHTHSTSISIMADFIMDILNYLQKNGHYPRFKIGDILPDDYRLPR